MSNHISIQLQSLNKPEAKLPEQYWEHLNVESLTEGKVKEFLTIYNKLHNCASNSPILA
jgi:hypothetical protein